VSDHLHVIFQVRQVKIPYALGLIATRSTTKEVTGLKDLMQQHEVRIRNGMLAYGFNILLACINYIGCIFLKK
jgi:cytochrome bd-type quinol oxidase subunit 1